MVLIYYILTVLVVSTVAPSATLHSKEDPAVTGIIALTLNDNETKWYTLSGTDEEGYFNTASWQYYNDPVSGIDYILIDLYAFPGEQTVYDGPFFDLTLLLEDNDSLSASGAIIRDIIFSPSGVIEDYYIHDESTIVVLSEFVQSDEHIFSITGKLDGALISELDYREGAQDERFFEFKATFRIERIDYEVLFE
jgi:hypothetical protein